MPQLLRSWAYLALLGFPLITATISCSKSNSDPMPATPTATTGGTEGTVSPAGSVATVTATNAGGVTFLATPNATTGAFSLANLAAGTYTLSFTPATGYVAPTNRTITIVAGQTAAAGTVTVASDGTIKSGTVTWTVGGTTYSTTTVSGLVDPTVNRTFSFSARATTGSVIDELGAGMGTTFSGGTGTFTLGNSPYQNATYLRTSGGLVTGQYYTNTGNTAGTFVITSYSAATGTIVGTFGFVANSSNSAGSISVTNGTFNLRF